MACTDIEIRADAVETQICIHIISSDIFQSHSRLPFSTGAVYTAQLLIYVICIISYKHHRLLKSFLLCDFLEQLLSLAHNVFCIGGNAFAHVSCCPYDLLQVNTGAAFFHKSPFDLFLHFIKRSVHIFFFPGAYRL